MMTHRRLAFVLGLVAGLLLGAVLAPRAASVQPHAILPLNEWQPIPSPAASADPSPTPTMTPGPSARFVAPSVPAIASKPASPPAHRIAGTATWYAARSGAGAAGPELRAWLGSRWRGMTVRVCSGGRCVTETLSDWGACPSGHRLIDLPAIDYAQLAPLSRGVVSITVSRL